MMKKWFRRAHEEIFAPILFQAQRNYCRVRVRGMQSMNGSVLRMLGIVLLTGFFLPFAGTKVAGEVSDSEVLRGIKSIGIEVEDLPRMAEKLGIKKESLKMDVASKLQSVGITVLSDDELKLNPSLPFLKVTLIIGYSKPAYIYAVVVGLNEKVSFERDPGIIAYAMPWWRIVKGEHARESEIARFVRETVHYIMNEFIANYNAVNPKDSTPDGKKSEQQAGDQAESGGDQGKQ